MTAAGRSGDEGRRRRRSGPQQGYAVAALLLAILAGCGAPQVPVPPDSERFDFELGRAFLERGDGLDAQTHLKRFLDRYPGHAVADSAQFLLGQALFGMKSYAEAAVEFAILVREFPRSDLRDDASFHECLCYVKQMRSPERDPTFALRARGCLNEFLLRYPDSALGDAAREQLQHIADRLAEKELRLAILFARLKRYRAGAIYLEELLSNYPSSRWVPDALLWMGICKAGMGESEAARDAWERLLQGFPEHPLAAKARQHLEELGTSAAAGPPPAPARSQSP